MYAHAATCRGKSKRLTKYSRKEFLNKTKNKNSWKDSNCKINCNFKDILRSN